ncbi:MAG: hypothetical protein WCT24_03090 [Patescibacteria group bacterium]|jgi:hypothetical protein
MAKKTHISDMIFWIVITATGAVLAAFLLAMISLPIFEAFFLI